MENEKKAPEKLFCPYVNIAVKNPVTIVGNPQIAFAMNECAKEKCGRFDRAYGCCADVALNKTLRDLDNTVRNIGNRNI